MGNRVLKAGWTNLQRNSYLSFASVGIMSLALAVVMTLMAFQFLTSEVVASLEEKVDISAHFNVDAPENDILAVKEELELLPNVKAVGYTSRDQALEEFSARNADNEAIQDSLALLEGENPLSATLNVQAFDPSQYASIAQFLDASRFEPLIDEVDYFENEVVINKVRNISGGIRNWGLATTLALALVAVLVTFNTIRLTIYSQKDEIEIMKLVGASSWQVRGPYVAEGGYYGLFAAILTMAIMYPIIYFVSAKFIAFSPETDLFGYFVSNIYQVAPIVLISGILLGTLSSMIAVRRHLKI